MLRLNQFRGYPTKAPRTSVARVSILPRRLVKPRGRLDWFMPTREQKRAYNRAYRILHRKKLDARNAEYRKAHSEELRVYSANWRAKNQDRIRATRVRYSREHPEKQKAWAANNLDKIASYAAMRRAVKMQVTIEDRKAIAAVYRLAKSATRIPCYLCGKPTKKGKRHVDHVIPLATGGKHASSNLAICCAGCNQRKFKKMPEAFGLLNF